MGLIPRKKEVDPGALIRKGICWGSLPLPGLYGAYHFVAAGDSRAGKTTIIQLLLQSVLPRIRPGNQKRALLFDAKGDLYPFLVALGVKDAVRLLNPFDARAYGWDMARDITDYATAREIAAILVPKDREPFFPLAAQSIIAAVIDGLNNLECFQGKWGLRELMLVLRSDADTKVVISKSPNAPHAYDAFLKGQRNSSGDVVATISAFLDRITPVAAAWEGRPKQSLAEWIQSESILVLGATPIFRDVLGTLNACIFHRACQLLGSLPEAIGKEPRPQTWVVIDELTYAGKLPMLTEVLATSASKGGCFVLGFQHIGPLREMYGESTSSIIRHCKNYAFLRTTDRETQEFLSKAIGNYEGIFPEWSYSRGDSTTYTNRADADGNSVATGESYSRSNGETVSNRREKRERLMPEQFEEDLPMPDMKLGVGVSGYFRVPHIEPTFITLSPDFLRAARVKPASGVPDLVPFAPKPLSPWRDEEKRALADTTNEDAPKAEPAPQKPPAPEKPSARKLPKRDERP